jgi:hypothetical protein
VLGVVVGVKLIVEVLFRVRDGRWANKKTPRRIREVGAPGVALAR